MAAISTSSRSKADVAETTTTTAPAHELFGGRIARRRQNQQDSTLKSPPKEGTSKLRVRAATLAFGATRNRKSSVFSQPFDDSNSSFQPIEPEVSTLQDDVAAKEAMKRNPELERMARVWICGVLQDEEFGTGEDLQLDLMNGRALCGILNALVPNAIPRVHQGKIAFMHRENIALYTARVQKEPFNMRLTFDTNDLYEGTNFSSVVSHIHLLARRVEQMADQNQLTFVPVPMERENHELTQTLYSQSLVGKNEEVIDSLNEMLESHGRAKNVQNLPQLFWLWFLARKKREVDAASQVDADMLGRHATDDNEDIRDAVATADFLLSTDDAAELAARIAELKQGGALKYGSKRLRETDNAKPVEAEARLALSTRPGDQHQKFALDKNAVVVRQDDEQERQQNTHQASKVSTFDSPMAECEVAESRTVASQNASNKDESSVGREKVQESNTLLAHSEVEDIADEIARGTSSNKNRNCQLAEDNPVTGSTGDVAQFDSPVEESAKVDTTSSVPQNTVESTEITDRGNSLAGLLDFAIDSEIQFEESAASDHEDDLSQLAESIDFENYGSQQEETNLSALADDLCASLDFSVGHDVSFGDLGIPDEVSDMLTMAAFTEDPSEEAAIVQRAGERRRIKRRGKEPARLPAKGLNLHGFNQSFEDFMKLQAELPDGADTATLTDALYAELNDLPPPEFSPNNDDDVPEFFKMFRAGKPDFPPKERYAADTAGSASPSTVGAANAKFQARKQWASGLPVVQRSKIGAAAELNKRGLRKARKPIQQEDRHFAAFPFADQPMAIACVFDGHSGFECAQDATEHFPRIFARALEKYDEIYLPSDLREELTHAFIETDSVMREHEYVGTTATVAVVWESGSSRYLQCANVGDSTAVLLRADGPLKLTPDHKPSLPEEKARIRGMGVEISDAATRVSGMAVSRAWGDFFLKEQNSGLIGEPAVGDPIELTEDDAVLIVASDGLWDVISPRRAVDTAIQFWGKPRKAARELAKMAVANPKNHDNTTVLCVNL